MTRLQSTFSSPTSGIRFWMRQTVQITSLLFAFNHVAVATTFNLPPGTDSLIDNSPNGSPVYIKAKQEDSLIDIAVQHLLGQEEIVRANKKVDRWLPRAGTEILIPSRYVLPNAPRLGIVINLPEYRLYYYVPGKNQVISYSVGIGRVDWKTPLGVTKVVGKVKNPTWTPPASIRAEHLAKGDVLPEVWAAGADNPLGLFAFRLGIPGYLLHSTNKPQGVGMQVSHGCMRLYPKDIEQLFPMLPIGTQVNIINQPVKVGWSYGQLFIESHPNLEGEETSYQQRLELALNLIRSATAMQPVSINDAALKLALTESNGLPTLISGSGDPLLTTPSTQPVLDDAEQAPVLSPPVLNDVEKTPSLTPPILIEPSPPVLNTPKPPVLEEPTVPVLIAPPPVLKKPPPVIKKPATPVLKKPPRLNKSDGKIPSSEIEEELQREEKEERVFKNSPFPRY